MSSTYRVLCLAHDPAIVITSAEFTDPREAIAHLVELAGDLGTEHRECDLVLGRFSYPLVELACPGRAGCGHPGPQWTDAGWLRLLLAAGRAPQSHDSWLSKALDHLAPMRRCWTFSRLLRLRHQLGLEIGAP